MFDEYLLYYKTHREREEKDKKRDETCWWDVLNKMVFVYRYSFQFAAAFILCWWRVKTCKNGFGTSKFSFYALYEESKTF